MRVTGLSASVPLCVLWCVDSECRAAAGWAWWHLGCLCSLSPYRVGFPGCSPHLRVLSPPGDHV